MKFRKFRQNKLWRDKLVDVMEQKGSKIHWTRLDDHAFANELKTKFMEEAHEVYNAATKEALLEELADVLEVIDAMCDVHHVTLNDIVTLQHKKREERGGFKGRKFVTVAEHLENSFGEKYCLADPKKYPEIID